MKVFGLRSPDAFLPERAPPPYVVSAGPRKKTPDETFDLRPIRRHLIFLQCVLRQLSTQDELVHSRDRSVSSTLPYLDLALRDAGAEPNEAAVAIGGPPPETSAGEPLPTLWLGLCQGLNAIFEAAAAHAWDVPVLSALSDRLQATLAEVLARRGSACESPLDCELCRPVRDEYDASRSRPPASVALNPSANPENLRQLLLGSCDPDCPGLLPGFEKALACADEQLSRQIGDLGIFLDTLA